MFCMNMFIFHVYCIMYHFVYDQKNNKYIFNPNRQHPLINSRFSLLKIIGNCFIFLFVDKNLLKNKRLNYNKTNNTKARVICLIKLS